MTAPRPVSPDALLAQAGWVRGLARGLLRDAHAAEDVVQDTWLAALRRGPNDGTPLRAWLGEVARNFARRRMRADARRGEHERLAATGDASGSATDLDERAALHRELVDVVMTLDEPYRSTILLRYFEELPPRAIARREGIPVRTVKTRLARALDKLREQLDARSRGDRTAWLSALVAFTRRPLPLATAPTVVTIMSTNMKLVAASVLLAGLVATFFAWKPPPGDRSGTLARSTDAPRTSKDDATLEAASIEVASNDAKGVSRVKEEAPKAASAAAEPLDPDNDLHGRVTNSSGQPLRGARIEVRYCASRSFDLLSHQPEFAEEVLVAKTSSDERGEFRVRLPRARPFDLWAKLAGYADRKIPNRFAGENVTVVLTAGCTIVGRVHDSVDGSPFVGARVHAAAGIIRLGGELEFVAETDEAGSYRLEDLPTGGIDLEVSSGDGADVWGIIVDAHEGATIQRDIVVERGALVTGIVTAADTGLPIPGAEVSAGKPGGMGSVLTDADGRYSLRGNQTHGLDRTTLGVRASGFATAHGATASFATEPARLDFALRAGRSAKGRVLGPDDRPVAGACVLACGSGARNDWVSSYDQRSTRTDAHGEFVVAELADDAHHLLFLRKEGCGTKMYDFPGDEAQRSEIDFGDVRLPDPATLIGRVIDENGKPVADAFVRLEGANADSLRFSNPDTGSLVSWSARQRSGRTDDRGRFGFGDLSPGTYAVHATAMRGSSTEAQLEVRIEEGETRDGVDLVLTVGLVLEGRVVDLAGVPVPGLWVSAHVEGAPPLARQASDVTRENGAFHLQGLEAGAYTVLIESLLSPDQAPRALLAPAQQWKDIPAGARDLRLVMPEAAWIEGVVLDPDGAPAAGAQIQATRADEEGSQESLYLPRSISHTDARGRFRAKVWAGGRAKLCAFSAPEKSGQCLYGAVLNGVAAGTTGVELKLAPWH